jgi:hypothetical protein
MVSAAAFALHEIYLVEQIVLAAFTVTFFVLFVQQLFAERTAKRSDALRLKTKLHWTGLLTTLLFAAAAIDLYGVRGLYGPNVTPWLLANVAVVLVAGGVFMVQALIELEFKAHFQGVPPWLGGVSWFLIVFTVVECNLLYGLAVKLQKWWITGFFEVWLAVLVMGLVICYLVALFELRRWVKIHESRAPNLGSKYNPPAQVDLEMEPRGRLLALKWKAAGFVFFAALVDTLMIALAVTTFQNTSQTNYSISLSQYAPLQHLLLYLEVALLAALLGFSWIGKPETATYDETRDLMPGKGQEPSQSWAVASRNRVVRVATVDSQHLSPSSSSRSLGVASQQPSQKSQSSNGSGQSKRASILSQNKIDEE